MLCRGDLIFPDYDFDDEWDHVVIYLDAYDLLAHAALTASDDYDECVIAYLDDNNDPLIQDIQWPQVSAQRLDHAAIQDEYRP